MANTCHLLLLISLFFFLGSALLLHTSAEPASKLQLSTPIRLKRSLAPFSQQAEEGTQQEEDEQSIIDGQKPDEGGEDNGGSETGNSNSSSNNNDFLNRADCGLGRFAAQDAQRIVGGRPASLGQFPWQVYLRITTPGGEMLCGGSIITPNWILTAAHCISSEQTGQYHATAVEVVAGALNRFTSESSRQSRNADCALKHPKWTGVRGGFANDIALIRVPTNRPFNLNGAQVKAICLPPKREPPFDYTGIARVAGWGLTRDRGSPSRTLQFTDVSIISDNKCRQYPYPVNILNSMACQGVDTSSPCQGDSGGPLVIRSSGNPNRYLQFGLVSFGPGICNNGRIPNAVFTQVSYHLTWIENTIRAYEGQGRSCSSRHIIVDSY